LESQPLDTASIAGMSEDSLPIRNKIQESGIQVLDPSDFLVPDSQIQPLDLAHYMDEWGVLREKDFRARVQAMDPIPFAGRWVALYCSSEAVWPPWAVMILAVHLQGGDYTTRPAGIEYGTPGQVQRQLALARIQQLDTELYRDARLMIKACSRAEWTPALYLALTQRLMGVVQSLFYGEPCSAFPIYKRRSFVA